MVTEETSRKIWALSIGFGLALVPIHNQWLTSSTTDDGVVTFFLPSFGYAIWMLTTSTYLIRFWEKQTLGEKRIYIPLLIIVACIGISGIRNEGIINQLTPLFMGGFLFSLYIASRRLWKSILFPMAVGAGIASLGVIVYGLLNPGIVSGGVLFEGNYDIVVGYVLLGASFYFGKYRWLLAGLALVAMLMTGSPEAIFVLLVMGAMVLWRRDYSRRLAYIMVPVVLAGIVYIGLGHGQELYQYFGKVLTNQGTQTAGASALEYRLLVIDRAMVNLKPLGDGYNVTGFYNGIVHNVPLIIVQQLGWFGMIAGIMWVWVALYCIIKTKWKYAWGLMLALSVFDHFTWTQLAPWYWALAGVSTGSYISNDWIFKNA